LEWKILEFFLKVKKVNLGKRSLVQPRHRWKDIVGEIDISVIITFREFCNSDDL
jgi:hypothetical protein